MLKHSEAEGSLRPLALADRGLATPPAVREMREEFEKEGVALSWRGWTQHTTTGTVKHLFICCDVLLRIVPVFFSRKLYNRQRLHWTTIGNLPIMWSTWIGAGTKQEKQAIHIGTGWENIVLAAQKDCLRSCVKHPHWRIQRRKRRTAFSLNIYLLPMYILWRNLLFDMFYFVVDEALASRIGFLSALLRKGIDQLWFPPLFHRPVSSSTTSSR